MTRFRLTILASDHVFYQGDAASVTVPTTDGRYGIQAHHSSLIGAVIPGKLTFTTPDGGKHIAAVSHGLFKMEENELLILTETAERPEEIDLNRAKRDAAKAKEEMLQKQSMREHQTAELKLLRALNRMHIKQERY